MNCNIQVCERIQVMGVWNSSRQTEHDIIPVFRFLSLRTERWKDRLRTSKKNVKERRLGDDVHFDITRLLVVTEGARELSVQVSGHLLLRWGFPFGLATTHCTQWRISKGYEYKSV